MMLFMLPLLWPHMMLEMTFAVWRDMAGIKP